MYNKFKKLNANLRNTYDKIVSELKQKMTSLPQLATILTLRHLLNRVFPSCAFPNRNRIFFLTIL